MTAQECFSTGLFKKAFTPAQLQSLEAIDLAWATMGSIDKRQQAYLYATIYHEVAGTMLPIKESGSDKYLKSKGYYPYFGRGYCQITWPSNYETVGKRIGQPLATVPDLALEPEIAAEIAVRGMVGGWFTGKRLYDYINENECDYINSRHIINGTDKAQLIAGYALKFEKAIS